MKYLKAENPLPRVWIIERDHELRSILRDLLTEVGYLVGAWAQPPDRDLLAQCRSNAVVLDVAGGRDGDDAERIAFLLDIALPSLDNPIPVVVCLGGRDLAATRRDQVKHCACVVISEAFDIERFIQAIDTCAEGTHC